MTGKYSLPPTGAHRPVIMGLNGMVAAGHPLATQAGLAVLRRGGNAFDAAFTTATVLAVVKPDMNGLGGDAFGLFYSSRENKVSALNASGPAPAAARLGYFQARPPKPRSGAGTATVPGSVAGWFAMLERFGTLSAAELLQPAIDYAAQGFPVNYFLFGSLTRYRDSLERYPATASIFLPGGRVPGPLERLVQPQLATTLRRLALEGASGFYLGETARAIANFCAENDGFLAEADLANFRPEWKEPIRTGYRGLTVYSQPPVSQGHILLEALNIIGDDNLAYTGLHSPETLHLLVEATRLAFADKLRFAGDPAFVAWPLDELLSPERARHHRKSIQPGEASRPAPVSPALPAMGGETTYFAVMDREGNAVSFIQSLFHAFGAGVVAGNTGVLLNDRLVGFSLDPESPNCLAPGKRPVHTLNPCLVMTPEGQPFAALGTPGSDGQVQTNLQLLTHLLDYELPVQAAIEAPRWRRSSDGILSVEDRFPAATLDQLAHWGYRLERVGHWSDKMGGAQIVMRQARSGVLQGGADPRREGYAAGW
ncbi:MAG: gamma-glutamyltransferase [Chloroflexi bacterium]|nr:gamma-glutamyltransferase [Chloroflexota bacterium]